MGTDTNTIEIRQIHCTTCPSECLLTVEVELDSMGVEVGVCEVSGNRCPRGAAFAHQEITRPMRVLTTTVILHDADERLLPVRTAEAIPLDLHAQAMELLQHTTVQAPVSMGDVVISNILDTGTDVVASLSVR